MKVKRFVVFFGDYYYPCGGITDKKGDFDTFDEAKELLKSKKFDWHEIWDLETNDSYQSEEPIINSADWSAS